MAKLLHVGVSAQIRLSYVTKRKEDYSYVSFLGLSISCGWSAAHLLMGAFKGSQTSYVLLMSSQFQPS